MPMFMYVLRRHRARVYANAAQVVERVCVCVCVCVCMCVLCPHRVSEAGHLPHSFDGRACIIYWQPVLCVYETKDRQGQHTQGHAPRALYAHS